jgi:hypothetical protein
MSQAQCSHSKVVRVTEDFPGGHRSEHWKCPDCDTRFWPETVDMHRIRLRDEFAKAALSALVTSALEEHHVAWKATAEHAFIIAQDMLIERDKHLKS